MIGFRSRVLFLSVLVGTIAIFGLLLPLLWCRRRCVPAQAQTHVVEWELSRLDSMMSMLFSALTLPFMYGVAAGVNLPTLISRGRSSSARFSEGAASAGFYAAGGAVAALGSSSTVPDWRRSMTRI